MHKPVNLLVVVVLVEFGHEVQQALAVATENLKHLSAVESVQTNTRHDMFKNAVILHRVPARISSELRRQCNMNHLGVLVGVSSEYFENVKRLELNAAAAVAQRIHYHLSTTV